MPITTLSTGLGLDKPSDPTYGDVFFPAMESNIQKINDHTHNGTLGNINPTSTVSVSSGAWGSDLGGGTYKQTKTIPSEYTTTNCIMQVRRTSTASIVYPTIVILTSSTIDIYTNDNSAAYTIHFL